MAKSDKELKNEFEKKEKRREQLRVAQKEFNSLHNRGRKKIQFSAKPAFAEFLQIVKEKEDLKNISQVIHFLANEYRAANKIKQKNHSEWSMEAKFDLKRQYTPK
jgi:hypothetical protein